MRSVSVANRGTGTRYRRFAKMITRSISRNGRGARARVYARASARDVEIWKTSVSLFHPATMTKMARYWRRLNEEATAGGTDGRVGQGEGRGGAHHHSPAGGTVDADPRVFIQLSNLFNVCIHCALPPCTLSRTQLGFNRAPFH